MNNEYGAFNAPRVANPFSFNGDSWGAWEVAVAATATTDLNWHENSRRDGHRASGIAGGDERIIGDRSQLVSQPEHPHHDRRQHRQCAQVSAPGANPLLAPSQIGQNFNELGARVQFQM